LPVWEQLMMAKPWPVERPSRQQQWEQMKRWIYGIPLEPELKKLTRWWQEETRVFHLPAQMPCY
jgi:hypothetical protein